ncbi:MAG: polyhydroxyalkanoic acid system family protein [Ignavibacteria bacterium]|nr:polyhydroxyalkanoic acid system family protein [Ignavibacteria bacterium]
MSKINLNVRTKYTAFELKNFVTTRVLTNSIITSFLTSYRWENYKLVFTSKFGNGQIELQDYLINFEMDLNILGQPLKGLIESKFSDELKKLE